MTNSDILREIKELCQGLALSEKARALRYDKIVDVLTSGNTDHEDLPSWVHILPNDGPFSDYWICGSCGWKVPGCTKPTGFTHCPHCGKQMREVNEDFKAWEEP